MFVFPILVAINTLPAYFLVRQLALHPGIHLEEVDASRLDLQRSLSSGDKHRRLPLTPYPCRRFLHHAHLGAAGVRLGPKPPANHREVPLPSSTSY